MIGPRPADAPATFGEAIERWLADLAARAGSDMEQGNAELAAVRARRLLVPGLGPLLLSAIDEEAILTWRDTLDSMAAGSIRRAVASLRRAWGARSARGWVSHDPTAVEPALVPPPTTTAGCPSGPVCERTACRYHLAPATQPAGRPRAGTIARPPVVLRRRAGCAIRSRTPTPKARRLTSSRTRLGLTPRRVEMLASRALAKVTIARQLEHHLEELRPLLPAGVRLTTAYPSSSNPGAVHIHVTIGISAGRAGRTANEVAGRARRGDYQLRPEIMIRA